MPHHKSTKKRLKQSVDRKMRNTALKTTLRKTMKDTREKIANGEAVDLQAAYANVDKVSGKGIIHKNKAARIKSRLTKAARRKKSEESAQPE